MNRSMPPKKGSGKCPKCGGKMVGLLGRVAVAGPGDVRLVLDPAVERLLRPA